MSSMQEAQIKKAAQAIKNGDVIAYPTEAVWGLGCDPFNKQAVLNLLTLKQRDYEKGMILAASTQDQIEFLIKDLPSSQRETLKQYWPGPYTFLIPDPDNRIPEWVKGEHQTIAVRVSAHPIVKALCESFGGPIVSTSCNRQGMPPALTRESAVEYFPGGLGAIAPGEIGDSAKPSEIRDLVTGELVRAG